MSENNVVTFTFKTEAPYSGEEMAKLGDALLECATDFDDDLIEESSSLTVQTEAEIQKKNESRLKEMLDKCDLTVRVSIEDENSETVLSEDLGVV